jgi:hypothetical protein
LVRRRKKKDEAALTTRTPLIMQLVLIMQSVLIMHVPPTLVRQLPPTRRARPARYTTR